MHGKTKHSFKFINHSTGSNEKFRDFKHRKVLNDNSKKERIILKRKKSLKVSKLLL